MGRYSDAVDAYDHAVTIDPSYEKGWINKGNALIGAGRNQEAIDAFNKALSLDPGNTDATDGIAQAQKGAAALPVNSIVLVIILVIAAGAAVWYFKFRKPETKEQSEKKSKEDKK
jgi:cytochrome c-type biogenesis protein CcmH/NrfG